MSIQPGDNAPLFNLYDSDKNEVKLEDFHGKKVVLLFFPFAFTSTCTAELCSVRDEISYYDKLNASVLAISVDSPHTLGRFKKEHNLNMTLLSDFNKEVSKNYGSLYESFSSMGLKGVSKRSAFVIDSKGVIRYAEVLEKAGELPDLATVKETLKTIN